MQCLNLKNKEVKAAVDELTIALGSEDAAYYIISENNGYAIDQAPNGAQSKLFNDLLEHYKGDRNKAIQSKSKVFTDEFKQWFGDWLTNPEQASKVIDDNSEPMIVYHGSNEYGFTEFSKQKLGSNTGATSAKKAFFFAKDKNVAESYISIDQPGGPVDQLNYQIDMIVGAQLDAAHTVDISARNKVELEKIRDLLVYEGANTDTIALIDSYIKDFDSYIKSGQEEYDTLHDQLYSIHNTNIEGYDTYAVFLNIKNPLVYDYNYGDRSTKTYAKLLNEAQRASNDGTIFKNTTDGADIFTTIVTTFEPNQIKSIDNEGTFSEQTNNIYKVEADVDTRTADEVMQDDQVERVVIIQDGTNNGQDVLDRMLDSGLFFQDDAQRQLAAKLNLKDCTVEVTSNPYENGAMWYAPSERSITILDTSLYDTNYNVTRKFLHEAVHHHTVTEYKNNPTFAKHIDSVFNKISSIYPASQYGRKGLYYGLSSPLEFISEVMTNSAFRDLVAKHNMSVWKKFIYAILKGLGFNNIAKTIKSKDTIKLVNEITKVIENRNTDPRINELGDGIYYLKEEDPFYNELSKQAKNTIAKINNGLNSRYRSLKSQNYPPLQLARLQQQIDQYHDMLQKEQDKEILLDFIKDASIQFKPVLKRIRQAYQDPSIITNERLRQFQNDFLDFYGPMINEINKMLNLQGYFSDLDKDQQNQLNTRMNLITRAYLEIEGKYQHILRTKVKDMLEDYGRQFKVPTDEIDKYLKDNLNSTDEDITLFSNFMQSTKSVSDLSVRIAHRLMTDINNEVSRFANDRAQSLIREFDKIDRSDVLLYFEKDKNGKATGFLVRDRNYGEFKRDMSKFLTDLDVKYGVVDNNYYALNDEEFSKYVKEKEQWLEEHCERKFKKEYYQAYNELKPITRLKLKSINSEISNIIKQTTDETGPHLENLKDSDWKQLDDLYSLKRNLSNIYYQNGELKHGEDKDIAEDLQKFLEATGDGKIKSIKFTQKEVEDLIEKKRSELSPDKFNKWRQRNISYQYSEEFIEILKSLEKADYGESQQELDELYEERRKLMQLGKNNNQPKTDAYKLLTEVKDRILELDQRISDIRSSVKSKNDFSKYAEINETDEYFRDKKQAKALGKEAYNEWYDRSHYDRNGKSVPVSYYTVLVPLNPEHVEIRLSRMNKELDKNSKLVNENYDFNNPEFYQPTKKLYDNTEAYKQATNSKQKKDIYNLITSTMNESNSKIQFMSRRDNYKLPQITGDIVDFTTRGNKFFEGIAKYAFDDILIRNDDSDYSLDNFTQKPDGTKLNFVPTHYIKMLDNPEHISRNMIGLLTEYSRMAENYRIKNEKKSDFEILNEQIAKKKFIKYDSQTLTKQEVSGKESNIYRRYNDFLEMNLYGQYRKPASVALGSNKQYQLSFTKVMYNVKNYATASNLGNNMPAIGKALVQGTHKSIVEALAGRYYNANDYFRALGQMIFNIPRMLFHIGDKKHNYLPLAIMEHNEIAREVSNKTEGIQYNRLRRTFRKNLIWAGWSAVDYLVKTPVVQAIYSDYKYDPVSKSIMSKRNYIQTYYSNDRSAGSKKFKQLNTFSMLDVYEVKDGVLVIKDKYKQYESAINDKNTQNSIRNISKFLTNRIDGVLAIEDKTRLMTNAFGACIFMHRSFFIANLEDNFLAEYQYNPYIEDYYEAKYSSSLKALAKVLQNVMWAVRYAGSKEQRQAHYKKVSDVQQYNLTRVLTQLSLVGIYSLLSAIWLKPSADDEPDNWLLNLIGYTISGTAFEEWAEYWLPDFWNQIKSPSAAIAPVENLGNTFKLLNPFAIEYNWSDEEIKKGPYKDMERWQRSIIRSIPGIRGAWESRDIRTKWEYLDTQLDK